MVSLYYGTLIGTRMHQNRLSRFLDVGFEICPFVFWPLTYTTACTSRDDTQVRRIGRRGAYDQAKNKRVKCG